MSGPLPVFAIGTNADVLDLCAAICAAVGSHDATKLESTDNVTSIHVGSMADLRSTIEVEDQLHGVFIEVPRSPTEAYAAMQGLLACFNSLRAWRPHVVGLMIEFDIDDEGGVYEPAVRPIEDVCARRGIPLAFIHRKSRVTISGNLADHGLVVTACETYLADVRQQLEPPLTTSELADAFTQSARIALDHFAINEQNGELHVPLLAGIAGAAESDQIVDAIIRLIRSGVREAADVVLLPVDRTAGLVDVLCMGMTQDPSRVLGAFDSRPGSPSSSSLTSRQACPCSVEMARSGQGGAKVIGVLSCFRVC